MGLPLTATLPYRLMPVLRVLLPSSTFEKLKPGSHNQILHTSNPGVQPTPCCNVLILVSKFGTWITPDKRHTPTSIVAQVYLRPSVVVSYLEIFHTLDKMWSTDAIDKKCFGSSMGLLQLLSVVDSCNRPIVYPVHTSSSVLIDHSIVQGVKHSRVS